jgi:hypothetical protein
MKFKLIICSLLLVNSNLRAQTDADALRYTIPFAGSTARSAAIGGAFGAIGADFSSLSINPAGLGVYRKSEISISPSFQSTNKKSTFFGTANSEIQSTVNLQNWGFVFSSKLGKDDNLPEWKYFNFGIGMNRYNILSSNTFISGNNQISSIGDFFVNQANGTPSEDLNGFQSGLAYNAFFIDPDTNVVGNYISISKGNNLKQQSKAINSQGSVGETVLSFAANYANRWYFGGTIGIAKINYIENTTFLETDNTNLSNRFKEFEYNEKLTTRGNGFNLKLGTIYRPADWIRLGLAFHTPTSYSLTDNYSASMTTYFDSTDISKNALADNAGGYTYRFRTPLRLIASLGFVIGKYGFISIDNEWLDYRTLLLRPNKDFRDVNQLISNKYTSTNNLKIGGEINLKPYAIRLGYSNFGNAFNTNYKSNNSITNYTFGIGYRNNNFFIDFAFIYSQSKTDKYYIYDSNLVPATNITTQRSTIISTIGFKW